MAGAAATVAACIILSEAATLHSTWPHGQNTSTARGFEPLRAEPNGFLVHHLSHSVTLSHSCEVRCAAAHDCCRHSCGLGPDIRARPGGGGRGNHSCSLHHPESSSNAAQHMATWPHGQSTSTARGFEPLRAEPNGFLVHHLNHAVTLSTPNQSNLRTTQHRQQNEAPQPGCKSEPNLD